MERFIICRKESSGETFYSPEDGIWYTVPFGNCLWWDHPGSDIVATLSTARHTAYVRKLTLTLGEIVE